MRYSMPIFLFGLLFLIAACTNKQTSKKEDLRQEISALTDSINKLGKADKTPEEHRKTSEKAIQAMKNYVNNYPKDSLTPDFLYQIGNIYRSHLGNAPKAVDYYQQLVDQHPDHERAPFALFTQAFVYENNPKLRDLELAESKYKTFLDQYPDHELSKDAKQSLEYLGLSGEEQLKRIRQKRADSTSKEG